MDEQNGGGQQPGAWEAPAASASQPGQPDPRLSGPAEGQPAGASDPAAPGPEQPGQSGTTAFTQPIGLPQPDYPSYGYGQPGDRAAADQPGGYGMPGGYSQSGFGQPGGYGPPPGGGYYAGGGGSGGGGYAAGGGGSGGGGYGQPPGGYGMPPGYGGPNRPRRRGLSTIITYLAVAALAATAGGLVVSFADTGSNPPGASSGQGSGSFGLPSNGSGSAGISSATVQNVQSAVEPGVVVINSNLQYDGGGAAAAGTGMIISKSGLVLTNNHVINGTTGLSATVVTTGKRYAARWLGYDRGSDVAVIKLVGATGLTPVPVGDSSAVKVGDNVIAMGNADGTGTISTVTGTITGVNQTITASDDGSGASPERLTGMLQTNANIIRGDSGGPLANTSGKVIGMDTAASANSFANEQNVGFAIPINKALDVARKIIAGQSGSGVQVGTSGFVGVLVPGAPGGGQSTEPNPQVQLRQQEALQGGFGGVNPNPASCVQGNQSPGVPASVAPVSAGTLVLGTICQTPAASAGLIAGDVITSVGGQQVTSPASLMTILQAVHGGSTISMTWVTPSDQTMTRSLTLSAAPPQ